MICSEHGKREMYEFIAAQISHLFSLPRTRIKVLNLMLEVIERR